MRMETEERILRATEEALKARLEWERCFSKEFYEALNAATDHAPHAKAMIAQAKRAEYLEKCEKLFDACYIGMILSKPIEDK